MDFLAAGLLFFASIIVVVWSFGLADGISSSVSLSDDEVRLVLRRHYHPAAVLPIINNLKVSHWVQIFILSVTTGFVVFLQMRRDEFWVELLKSVVLLLILLVVAVVDWKTTKIPNFLPISLVALRVPIFLLEFFFRREQFKSSIISSAIGLLIGLLILVFFSIITKGGFGMGDVKIVAATGFSIGLLSTMCSLLYGMILCMFAAVFLILSKKKTLKDVIPFGPFFYFGYVALVIFGTFQ